MTARQMAVACLIAAGTTAPASAQSAPGRVELSVGAAWMRSIDYGTRSATETRANGSPFVLFSASTQLLSAAGVEARVGVRVTRRLELEATGSYAAPQLQIATSGDTEQAPATTATQPQRHYTISGGALWPLVTDRRTIPFIAGGVGLVRQLDDGDALATNGRQIYIGAGVKQMLVVRDRRMKAAGLRADARLVERSKEIAIDNRAHATMSISGSFFIRF